MCTIKLKVNNVNEAPYFLKHQYTIHIPEDSPIGFEVLQLQAKDNDRGDNARLVFQIGTHFTAFHYQSRRCSLQILQEILENLRSATTNRVIIGEKGLEKSKFFLNFQNKTE